MVSFPGEGFATLRAVASAVALRPAHEIGVRLVLSVLVPFEQRARRRRPSLAAPFNMFRRDL
jgi:hypothetical protein